MKKPLILILLIVTLSAAVLYITWEPVQGAIFRIINEVKYTNGLVGYWNFDGKNVNWATGQVLDSSGSNNTGNLIGMSTTTSPIEGIIGQGLKFNGVNSHIKNSFNLGTGDFSISLWYKTSSKNQNFLSNAVPAIDLSNNDPARLRCGVNAAGTTLAQYLPGTILTDNNWHHVVCQRSNGGGAYLYFDGAFVSSDTDPLSTEDLNFTNIGTNGPFIGPWFGGIMDEVRVYNRALSDAEIQYQYQRTSPKFGSKINAGQDTKFTNGLVGYWNFDGKNVNWATGQVLDSSGSNNTGNLIGMSTTTSPIEGIVGQGLRFDGTNDRIILPDIPAISGVSQVTISAWVNVNTWTARSAIFQKSTSISPRSRFIMGLHQTSSDGVLLYLNDDVLDLDAFATATGILTHNKWQHWIMVFDGSLSGNSNRLKFYLDGVQKTLALSSTIPSVTPTNTVAPQIGGVGSGSALFDGSIDEVRVYNRALSAAEISDLYRTSAPKFAPKISSDQNTKNTNGLVGLWTFNGPDINWATGVVSDRSGQGNHGNQINMSTTTSPVEGIIGQGLFFDGVDDRIVLPDVGVLESSSHTISFWAKSILPSTNPVVYSEGTPGDWSNNLFLIKFGSNSPDVNGGIIVWYKDSGGTGGNIIIYGTNLADNRWHHVAYVQTDLSNRLVYVDGKQVASDTTTRNALSVTSATIGAGNNNGTFQQFYKDTLDEVRVYNRALSAAEVYELYRSGKR